MQKSTLKQKLLAMIIAGFAAITPLSAQVVLPQASQFYDFDGIGEKGFLSSTRDGNTQQFNLYNGISSDYSYKNTVFSCDDNSFESARFFSAEDVNKDGKPDFCFTNIPIGQGSHFGFATDRVLISQPDNTYTEKDALLLPNCDLNLDGRIDLIEYNYDYEKGVSLYLHTQQANGSFTRSFMQRMSQTEYDASQNQEEYEAYLQAVQAGYRPPKPHFSGVWLGPSTPAAFEMKPPTEVSDMNGDGNPDLFFGETGIVLFGTEQPDRFVQNRFGNSVKARDLNGDGFTDYIIWDATAQQLKTAIYRGVGNYQITVLMSDIPADKNIYCYDFDKDGDVDILATFSYPFNNVGSFTLFAQNDGNGNFTTHENGSTTDKLYFAGCKDINGDGYYDLLAFDVNGMQYYSSAQPLPVKVMYGQAGGSFGTLQTLYTANETEEQMQSTWNWGDISLVLNAEDLDNDGKMEIWYAGDDYFHIIATATANTAPTAPAAPSVIFNAATGRLDINWTAATDAQSSACDLTYEVRIGSAPGKSDILFAHANADGTRRNFADGNAGNNLYKVMDASTWQPGTYYIAVQTIDPQHAGSVWSAETVFENTILSPKFTTNKNSLAFCDTLKVYYNSMPEGYTLHWELSGATQLSSSTEGELHLKWASAGNKTISLQIETPDGTHSETTEIQIAVLDNKIEGIEVDRPGQYEPNIKEDIYQGWFADWNMNGKQDVLLGAYNNAGLFTNDGAGNFSKIGQIAYLSFAPSAGKWLDWDRDGVVDLLYHEGNSYLTGYGWAKNNGSSFAGKSAITITGENNFLYVMQTFPLADLDNNGDLDPVQSVNIYDGQYNSYKLYKNDGNGNFSPGFDIPDGQNAPDGYQSGIADWNKDGFLDLYAIDATESNAYFYYNGIKLLENKGNYNFEYKYIPFENTVSNGIRGSSLGAQIIFAVADMDNDGYLDVVYIENKKRIQILRNENNERFVKGDAIIIENPNVSIMNYFPRTGNTSYDERTVGAVIKGDLDNNGYLDMLVDAEINNQYVAYIVYNDGNGNYRHGELSEMQGRALVDKAQGNIVTDTDGDGVPNISLGTYTEYGANYGDNTYYLFDKNLTSATNTAPNAPTGIIATQTEEALIIEWDAAVDAETPAAQMKYNLSVKKKGASGANAYIISPLNGGNAAMAALPSPKGGLELNTDNFSKYYLYPTATRFEIPLSAIPAGEVEISVQAIDLWDAVSPFSEVFTKKVEATASFKIPATACFDSPTEIVYTGAQGGTPQWDFDGGQVVSGTGFGPYNVKWNSEGIKTITLTNGTNTATAQIKVLPDFSAEFTLPDNVFFNTDTEIGLPVVPQGSSFAWELSNRVGNFIDNDVWGRPGDSKGGIRIYRGGYIYRELTLTVYTPNGCTKSYTKGFNVVEPIAPPQIALVYPDGNKNVVAWETSSLPADAAQVVIYKEGSALNNFIEIGRVNTSENTFTDPSSNNTVRSDRYAISAVTASGVETAKSGIHKTMHLTINRGVTDGTWNLIWNKYEGREIGTYRILQGATPDNLTNVLDEISGANTSFTQFDNPDAPYYAVEYIPSSAQVRSARLRSGEIFLAGEIPTSGRTNVVNSNNAATIVYVSNMNILALGNDDVLKEENPSIYLYTELFPSNASYQNIAWSITSGNQYATINSSGNLQATGNTQGGQVTVKAAAVDGSEVFATRTFTVQAFSEAPQPIDPPYNLQTQVNGNQVTFSWQGYSNKYRITVADEEYNGFNEIVSGTTLTRTLPVSVGSYAWRVVSLSDDEADSTSDWTVGTDFIVTGSTTVLDPPHTANTNVSENEVTFTWQGSTNKYRIVVVDEVTLEGFNEVVTGTQLIRELPSGNYMWRIASLSDDENSQSDWTEWAYFTVSGIVGIDNPASGNVAISIYPNPVKDILRIESGETAFGGSQLTITNVEIIDLSGKQLMYQQSPSSQINVSNLVQGVYFIKIETDNGVLIEKFIKE